MANVGQWQVITSCPGSISSKCFFHILCNHYATIMQPSHMIILLSANIKHVTKLLMQCEWHMI